MRGRAYHSCGLFRPDKKPETVKQPGAPLHHFTFIDKKPLFHETAASIARKLSPTTSAKQIT